MNSLNLTHSDEKFLKDNFLVYHPETATTSQNFTDFKSKKVVFVGETHFVLSYKIKQAKLLEKFARPNSCRILEELFSGCVVDSSQVNEFEWSYSRLVHIGGDIRGFRDVDEYCAFEKKSSPITKLHAEYIDLFDQRSQEAAALLNELTEEGELTYKNSCVEVDEAAFERVKHIWEDTDALDAKKEEIREAEYRFEQFIKKSSLQDRKIYQVYQSNKGLARQIIEAADQYEQIFAIWGKCHFSDQVDLYEQLRKNNISAITLFPKNELNDDFDSNDSLGREGLKRYSLFLTDGKTTLPSIRILDFTSRSLCFLKPAIRKVLTPYAKAKNKLKLTLSDFQKAAKNGDKIQIAAKKTVCIVGVDCETASLYDDAQELQEDLTEYLSNIFNRFFIFSGVNITALDLIQEAYPFVDSISHRQSLVFNTIVPLTFTLTTNHFSIDVRYFLNALMRDSPPQYVLTRGKTLIFTDIDEEALNVYQANDSDLEALLTEFAPARTIVSVAGSYSLCSHNKAKFLANDDLIFSVQEVIGPILRKRKLH